MAAVLASLPARADVIALRGGGRVEGKVIADPSSDDGGGVLVVLPKGKTPLTLRKDQIRDVESRPGPLDEYAARREKLAPTARAEYELGAWCETHELPDLAELHYEEALTRDPDFAEARRQLGHVARDGRWLTPEEQRRESDSDFSDGEWSPDDEEEARETAESAAILGRIKAVLQGLASESADRRSEAEDQLMAMKEPEAVGPLAKALGGREPEFRALLARALGGIPGDAASRALVAMVLREPEAEVRDAILDALRGRDGDAIPARLIRALKSRDVRVVNRAAWALGNLGVFSAVPRLLNVLVTTEERMVLVPSRGPALQGPPGPLIGYNGSSAAYMIGPVVGPGVAAYGATAVPNVIGFDPMAGGAPIVFGDGVGPLPSAAGLGPRPAIQTFTIRNAEVLGALNRLTGVDFGFDVPAWRAWVARSFNPRPERRRMVPQP